MWDSASRLRRQGLDEQGPGDFGSYKHFDDFWDARAKRDPAVARRGSRESWQTGKLMPYKES